MLLVARMSHGYILTWYVYGLFFRSYQSLENSNTELSRKWIILNDLKREETKLQNFSVGNKKNGSIMALVRGPEKKTRAVCYVRLFE